MNALRKHWAVLLAATLVVCGSLWMWRARDGGSSESTAVPINAGEPGTGTLSTIAGSNSGESAGMKIELDPSVVEERHKAKDREHLRQLHRGLFDYKKAHGHFPEYLSQLVPDFVSAEALESPRNPSVGMNINLSDHPDPGNERPGYGFEFSNLVFRDERTFAEIKEVQRAEWGDAVPILRAFGYGKVINMSYGGTLYETDLNWEWDSATLDVVKAHGWGPGLATGEFSEVRVLDADGRPVANAQVWAGGRKFSFDLPNRPFVTDTNGLARIPLGSDLDRTALVLRAEASGLASPTVAFPLGQPPASHELRTATAQAVGGRVTDANGAPIPHTWIYLKAPASAAGEAGANLGAIKTDGSGQWAAHLHAADAAKFNIVVSSEGLPAMFSAGEPVDAATAATRDAVSIFHPPANPSRAMKGAGE